MVYFLHRSAGHLAQAGEARYNTHVQGTINRQQSWANEQTILNRKGLGNGEDVILY